MYYYLSLGTNIDVELSAVSMVRALITRFGSVGFYPFQKTLPEDIESEQFFLNSLAVLYSNTSASAIKAQLNEIETSMGRDRSDPQRSKKARTADLDIIASSQTFAPNIFKNMQEQYVQDCLAKMNEPLNLEPYGLPLFSGSVVLNTDKSKGKILVCSHPIDQLRVFVEKSTAV